MDTRDPPEPRDRFQRITKIWDWLPAFRAIAETENMHRAAERLASSPSALSRTLGLLEKEIGAPLFQRVGRSLRLTELGHDLLVATRNAMRSVDDASSLAKDGGLAGPLKISSAGRLTIVPVMAVLRRLMRAHPNLVPHILGIPFADVAAQVLRGGLDVALVFEAPSLDGLAVGKLGEATNGIYCGRGHPLHGRARVSVDDVLRHSFAAPEPQQAGGTTLDGWPAHLQRKIALYSSLLDAGTITAIAGEMLAVFPDVLVSGLLASSGLQRLPIDLVPPTPIFAVTRARVGSRRTRADFVVEELQRELTAPPTAARGR